MSFATILYERNGTIRFAPSGSASVDARGKTPGQATRTQGVPRLLLGPAKRRIRNGAVAMLFAGIWNAVRSVGLWVVENSREAQYRRVESYLASRATMRTWNAACASWTTTAGSTGSTAAAAEPIPEPDRAGRSPALLLLLQAGLRPAWPRARLRTAVITSPALRRIPPPNVHRKG